MACVDVMQEHTLKQTRTPAKIVTEPVQPVAGPLLTTASTVRQTLSFSLTLRAFATSDSSEYLAAAQHAIILATHAQELPPINASFANLLPPVTPTMNAFVMMDIREMQLQENVSSVTILVKHVLVSIQISALIVVQVHPWVQEFANVRQDPLTQQQTALPATILATHVQLPLTLLV